MKAKLKPRIDLENRERLENVIPLQTPFIVNIDPCDRCNFRCKFCPTGDLDLMKRTPGRNYGVMDFDLYKKIIEDIGTFENKVKVVRLYKDGEPLLNPRFADMVKYAKESGYCERVDTTTNASLLTPELSLKIIDAGLDRINISVEGVTRQQYQNFSGYNMDIEKYVENIRFFYDHRKQCEMVVKTNGDVLTEEEKEIFLNTFGDIADGIFIESIMDCWPTFVMDKVKVNDERGIYGQEVKEVMTCPYVFYSIAVNSNGTVSLCFLDWHRKLVIGNVREVSLKDIWLGKELKDYQKMFLRGERKGHAICRDCGQLSQGAPDNIDSYCAEILNRL